MTAVYRENQVEIQVSTPPPFFHSCQKIKPTSKAGFIYILILFMSFWKITKYFHIVRELPGAKHWFELPRYVSYEART